MTDHHDQLRVGPDPVRAEELRQRLRARLASVSRIEPTAPIDDAVEPVPSVDPDPDRRGDLIMLETEDRPTRHQPTIPARRSPNSWLLVAAAAVVITVVGSLLVVARGEDDDEIDAVTTTPTTAESPFVGTWLSTDAAGRRQTMYIDQWDADIFRVRVRDEAAVCERVGRLATDGSLVIASFARPDPYVHIELSCDAATSSSASDPTELGFTLDPPTAADQLVDSFGIVWREQVAPPPDTEDLVLLEAFLGARVAGESTPGAFDDRDDAEQYVGDGSTRDRRVPLMYATTSGAAYERFEIERAQDPDGTRVYDVRMFAESGTVVQQRFQVADQDGRLVVAYEGSTLEDGHAALLSFSLLDGEVRFRVASTWEVESSGADHMAFLQRFGRSVIAIAAEPVGIDSCGDRPAPADAEALARSVIAYSGHEVTEPVPVRIAGIRGLQVDVAVSDQHQGPYGLGHLCSFEESGILNGLQSGGTRIRLFMVDRPGEPAGILTFAVMTVRDEFDDAIAETTPIIDSIEIL